MFNLEMTELDRLERLVMRDPNSGCWLFFGADNGDGYGCFRRSADNGGKCERAHRVSYKIHKGEIPSGKVLDHLCRVRCCVNPDHLEPVTQLENIRRGNTGENQRRKTHCPQGHSYSGENLYIKPNGSRDCKKCRYEALKRHREKKNEQF